VANTFFLKTGYRGETFIYGLAVANTFIFWKWILELKLSIYGLAVDNTFFFERLY